MDSDLNHITLFYQCFFLSALTRKPFHVSWIMLIELCGFFYVKPFMDIPSHEFWFFNVVIIMITCCLSFCLSYTVVNYDLNHSFSESLICSPASTILSCVVWIAATVFYQIAGGPSSFVVTGITAFLFVCIIIASHHFIKMEREKFAEKDGNRLNTLCNPEAFSRFSWFLFVVFGFTVGTLITVPFKLEWTMNSLLLVVINWGILIFFICIYHIFGAVTNYRKLKPKDQ